MTRRAMALVTTTLALLANPVLAADEPVPAGRPERPEADPRDGRMRTVEYGNGKIISLVASRGRTLVVELAPGLDITSVLASDQDVIDGTLVDEDPRGGSRPASGVAGTTPAQGVRPCSVTANLQICIRLDRFLAIKPLTDLDPQPIHVIALRARGDREPEAVPFLFEIETQRQDQRTRTASNGAPPLPQPYYAVRVTMPAPPAPPPAPARAARSAPRRVAEPAYQPPPPPPLNRAYEVQGDPSLVGAPGR